MLGVHSKCLGTESYDEVDDLSRLGVVDRYRRLVMVVYVLQVHDMLEWLV